MASHCLGSENPTQPMAAPTKAALLEERGIPVFPLKTSPLRKRSSRKLLFQRVICQITEGNIGSSEKGKWRHRTPTVTRPWRDREGLRRLQFQQPGQKPDRSLHTLKSCGAAQQGLMHQELLPAEPLARNVHLIRFRPRNTVRVTV